MTEAQSMQTVYAALSQYAVYFVIMIVITIVAQWKIFTKAGEAGWKSIIPIYNAVVLFKIVGLSPWLLLLYLTSIIPIVGGIIIFVLTIVMNVKLAKVFGKSGLFAVGLIFLSVIFQLILAFGSAEYVKPEED